MSFRFANANRFTNFCNLFCLDLEETIINFFALSVMFNRFSLHSQEYKSFCYGQG